MLRRQRLLTLGTALALPLSALLYFGLEVYLANVLGANGFAQYAAFAAASGVLVYVVTIGIPGASTKFIAEYQATNADDLLHAYSWWSFTTGTVLTLAIGFPLALIYVWAAKPVDLGSKVAVAIASTSFGLFLWLWSRQTAIGAGIRWISVVPKEIAFPLLLAATVGILAITTFAKLALAYVVVLLMVEVPVCILLLLRLGGRPIPRVRHKKAAEWVAVALPLGAASLASAGLARWDVINASALLPPDDVAAYAAAARVALVGGIVQRAFEVLNARELVTLRLSAPSEQIRTALRTRSWITGTVSALLLGGVVVFGDLILQMFGAFAVRGATALKILVVAQFVHCVTAPYDVYMAIGQLQKVRAVLLVGASVATLVLTALGANRYGVVGCALGVFVSVTAYRILGVLITERTLIRVTGAA